MADFSKELYKKALATVIGVETVVGKGPSGKLGRKLLDTAMRGFVATGRIAVPAAARATGRTALGVGRAAAGLSPGGLALLGGLTLYEANQMGLLDAPIERTQDLTARALFEAGDYLPQQTPQQMLDALTRNQGIKKPKKATKYNRAVKAGMAAAKASQYFGKKNTISRPKAAFKAVNSVASRINRGKKVSAKGSTGKIARAVRRILK